MTSNPSPPEHSPARQRVRASGTVCSRRGVGNELETLHQSGGAKIRLPRSDATALSAVLLNTAGGLTGDDEIRWQARAGARSRLSVSTAASEKVYRTHGPSARQHTALKVASAARLDWLPQETILFDGARLARTLHVDLARDATLLAVEAIAFGRRASGESLRLIGVRDDWRVHRDGVLLHAEAFRLEERAPLDDDACRTDRASASEYRGIVGKRSGIAAPPRGMTHDIGAMATVLYCAPDGREALERLADELTTIIDAPRVPGRRAGDGSRRSSGTRAIGGASAMDGRIVLRLAAPSGFELRRILLPCLTRLQGDAPLPRVWHV